MANIIPFPEQSVTKVQSDPLEALRLAITAMHTIGESKLRGEQAAGMDNPSAAGRLRGFEEALDLIAFLQDRSACNA